MSFCQCDSEIGNAHIIRIAEHAQGLVKAVKLVYKVAETNDVVSRSDAAMKAPELGSNW